MHCDACIGSSILDAATRAALIRLLSVAKSSGIMSRRTFVNSWPVSGLAVKSLDVLNSVIRFSQS